MIRKPRKPRRGRPKDLMGYLLSFLLGVLLILGVYAYFSREKSSPPRPSAPEVSLPSKPSVPDLSLPAKPSTPRGAHRPQITIVIDDLGSENHLSKELLRWDFPLTFAILPFTPYSKTLARDAHRMGKEVILHLPMEPHRYPNAKPGKGVLLEEMDEERLLLQLSKDIEAIPYIKGVSNHMGSRLMEDPEKVQIILSDLKRRGLFFLDSRTTAQTVGLRTAHSIGLKAMERTLFIDHLPEEKDIRQKMDRLMEVSLSTGKAIGIGHPHPSTIQSIKAMIPKIQEKGIDLVPLSVIME